MRLSVTADIRRATIGDLDLIYEIELECFTYDRFPKNLLEHFLRSRDFVTLIAFLNGQPAGFITGSISRSKGQLIGHIFTLDVKRDYRRRRAGSELLKALEQIFIENRVDTCHLEVRVNNIAAKGLYLKHNYKPFELLEDYYGLGQDGVRFRKDLRTNKQRTGQKCSYISLPQIMTLPLLEADTMKTCENCGKALTGDENYCPYCGAPAKKTTKEIYSVSSDELMKKIKELIHEGNVTKIVVKNEKGETLLEIPVTVGVIGALLVPWMAALGVIAAMVTRCTIVVERREE